MVNAERTSRGPGSWFDRRFRTRSARHSLYCFPFAGGTANFYADWARHFDGAVELVPIQLPARGARTRESPAASIGDVADEVAEVIAAEPTRPLLFGHSMGAIQAFEVARRLRDADRPAGHLFVSGRPSPWIVRPETAVSNLPRAEFVRMLRGYGAADEEVLGNAELLDLLLPMMRADFSLIERYRYPSAPPLDCPIHAWCGDHDPEVGPDEMQGWEKETTADFELSVRPGDHFFLTGHRTEIVGAVQRAARRAAKEEADAAR